MFKIKSFSENLIVNKNPLSIKYNDYIIIIIFIIIITMPKCKNDPTLNLSEYLCVDKILFYGTQVK